MSGVDDTPPPSYDASNLAEEISRNGEMILNEEQNRVLDEVIRGRDTLITGPAGVGKSLLCKYICAEFDKMGKTYRIVAPTGVAAINVSGQTIHRFLGIRPDIKCLSDYIKLCMKRSRVPWSTLDVIMVDEISMVHPHLFQLFDEICRFHKRKSIPFGGIQMIFVGDFYQLCPIRQKTDKAGDPEYVFETKLWKELNPHVAVLTQVMRQNDVDFVEALNDLRLGLFSPRVVKMVQQCALNKRQKGKHYVRLFALNSQKNYANETQLAKLTSEEKVYTSVDIGNELYLKDCRAEKKINLKIGCPVMLLWNLPEHGLCNGSVGIVEEYDSTGLPVVQFDDGPKIPITQQTWTVSEKNRHGIHILASRTQVPLAVAYSISIHKSQGLTISHLVVDCTGIFTTGQLYVALSRASTMEGLIIKNFDSQTIMVDQKVLGFFEILGLV